MTVSPPAIRAASRYGTWSPFLPPRALITRPSALSEPLMLT